MDPDPPPNLGLFVSGLQDPKKKSSFFAYYFMKVHLHHSSKIKKLQNSKNKVVFSLTIARSIFRARPGSVPHTNESGRSKNLKILRIWIPNTAFETRKQARRVFETSKFQMIPR